MALIDKNFLFLLEYKERGLVCQEEFRCDKGIALIVSIC